ncbi:MAG: hypothetical protein ACR2M0_14000 [Chloroflexia bacterium]
MSDQRRRSPAGDSFEERWLAERSRNAVVDAELLAANKKIEKLEEDNHELEKAYGYKDTLASIHEGTIETLKVELRAISNKFTQVHSDLVYELSRASLPSAPAQPALPAPTQEAEPPQEQSQAAQEAQMALKLALMDLEDRLQQAVGLVLNELNTRKAAEARIRELEQQLAAVRRRIGGVAE